MKSTKQQLRELLEKSEWADEEKKWMLDYFQSSDLSELKELMQQQYAQNAQQLIDPEISERMLQNIHQKLAAPQKTKARIAPFRTAHLVAASIILLIITATILYFAFTDDTYHSTSPQQVIGQTEHDIAPGGDKVMLTLDNGSQIILDSAKNGSLVVQGNTRVVKQPGTLAYNAEPQVGIAQQPVYNIITTPKGGQYLVILSDGTKVWLNAASSVRFPTAFIDKERKVEITGEVYLEVTTNVNRPFKVVADGAEVFVTGTSFNINAYEDEGPMKTTLVEGKVLVRTSNNQPGSYRSVKLQPGQQAQIDNKNEITLIENANVEEAIAWKNGVFSFNGTSLESAMRQIARWYDVEIVYEKNIPDIRFGGKIQRSLKLSQIIKGLGDADVHFRIDGRKLIVFP